MHLKPLLLSAVTGAGVAMATYSALTYLAFSGVSEALTMVLIFLGVPVAQLLGAPWFLVFSFESLFWQLAVGLMINGALLGTLIVALRRGKG